MFLLYREYGDQWHKGGTFGNKQNVFNDFIAAGEYLVTNKYTSSDKYVKECIFSTHFTHPFNDNVQYLNNKLSKQKH